MSRHVHFRSLYFTLGLAGVLLAGGAARAIAPAPINGGCYQTRSGDCRVRVDPFVVDVAPGEHLVALRIQLNGQTVYDFSTDVSNPPTGDYAPTLPKLDLAARCAVAYTLSYLGRDSGDGDFVTGGTAELLECPGASAEPPTARVSAVPIVSGYWLIFAVLLLALVACRSIPTARGGRGAARAAAKP